MQLIVVLRRGKVGRVERLRDAIDLVQPIIQISELATRRTKRARPVVIGDVFENAPTHGADDSHARTVALSGARALKGKARRRRHRGVYGNVGIACGL